MDVPHSSFASQRYSIVALAILLLQFALAATVLAAPEAVQIVAVSDEIAVSQPDGGYEFDAHVAADRQGGWGVTWRAEDLESAPPTGRQRRFDRDGGAVSGSLRDHELETASLGLDGVGKGVLAGVRARPELGGSEVDAQCVDVQGAPRGARVRVDAGTISAASRRPSNVRVATASDGTSVVVWQETPVDFVTPPSVFFRRLLADCTPTGNVGSLGAVGVIGRREPEVGSRPDGGFVLAFLEGEATDNLKIAAQQFDAGGTALAPSFLVSQSVVPQFFGQGVAVASDGTFAVVWRTLAPPGVLAPEDESSGVSGRVFAADGTPLGGELPLRLPRPTNVTESAVAAVGASFVAVWAENGFVEEGSAVYGRAFEAAGPLGGEVVLNAEHTDPGSVGIASLGGNEFVVIWDDQAEQTLPPDIVARRFVLAPQVAGCADSASALCLGAERIRISVEWRDYQNRRGSGHAYPLTTDSGLFWFFTDTNLEVLVKVVNACAGFSRHWVYAAATTDVEYTLTATDTATGRSRQYFNPLGNRSAAITDSNAFATCP